LQYEYDGMAIAPRYPSFDAAVRVARRVLADRIAAKAREVTGDDNIAGPAALAVPKANKPPALRNRNKT
jgi:hypothetical protein